MSLFDLLWLGTCAVWSDCWTFGSWSFARPRGLDYATCFGVLQLFSHLTSPTSGPGIQRCLCHFWAWPFFSHGSAGLFQYHYQPVNLTKHSKGSTGLTSLSKMSSSATPGKKLNSLACEEAHRCMSVLPLTHSYCSQFSDSASFHWGDLRRFTYGDGRYISSYWACLRCGCSRRKRGSSAFGFVVDWLLDGHPSLLLRGFCSVAFWFDLWSMGWIGRRQRSADKAGHSYPPSSFPDP